MGELYVKPWLHGGCDDAGARQVWQPQDQQSIPQLWGVHIRLPLFFDAGHMPTQAQASHGTQLLPSWFCKLNTNTNNLINCSCYSIRHCWITHQLLPFQSGCACCLPYFLQCRFPRFSCVKLSCNANPRLQQASSMHIDNSWHFECGRGLRTASQSTRTGRATTWPRQKLTMYKQKPLKQS